MPGLIGLAFVVLIIFGITYIICRTQVRLKLNEYEYERSKELIRTQKYAGVDYAKYQNVVDELMRTHHEDCIVLSARLDKLEKVDADYKKKVDALVAKAGFGL